MSHKKPPVLRPHEEEEILNFILEKAKQGDQVKREEVLDLVIKFLKSDNRKNPFRNGVPGDKWFSLFRRRHNSHFSKLEKEHLIILERIGFTEKVLNTVVYKPISGVKRPIIVDSSWSMTPKRKRKPKEFKEYVSSTPNEGRLSKSYYTPSSSHSTPGMTNITPGTSNSMQAISVNRVDITESPGSDDSSNVNTDDVERESQVNLGDCKDFEQGDKLEVMDFNDDKWYPVRVVEIDNEEGEILVHFEKWSNRYDEWVRMDSNRIRRPQIPSGNSSKKVFTVNEKVLAVWAYNEKYPATVKKVLPNDKYEVLFSDGYAKILRGCKLYKATEEDLKNIKLPPPKEPAPPMGADPLDPNLGPKEERRLKKRRLDVYEALRPQKKQRLDHSEESMPRSASPSPTRIPLSKHKETFRVVLRGRPSMHSDESEGDDNEGWDEGENESDLEPTGDSEPKRRRRRKKKVSLDNSEHRQYQYRNRHTPEEDPDRWDMEIPEGVVPVQIKDSEGYYRESIIIPDKKLPAGWTKHTMRRKTGVKWDVFLVNADGRKFRSRNELRNYFAELKVPFPDESFDFMVGRKMEMIRSQTDGRRKPIENLITPPTKSSPAVKKSEKKSVPKTEPTPDSKKMKATPKAQLKEEKKGEQSPKPQTEATTPTLPSALAELRTPDGGYTCCGKSFRKENLFQMHMKHYHPEYSNFFGSTPNVADLAYARTVGEPLEDSRAEAMTPKNTLAERVSRYEADKQKKTPEPSEGASPGLKIKIVKDSNSTMKTEMVEEPKTLEKEVIKEEQPVPESKEEGIDKKEEEETKEVAKETDEKKAESPSEVPPDQSEEGEITTEDSPENETSAEEEEPSEKPASVPDTAQLPPPPTPPPAVPPPSSSTSLPVIKPVISKVGSSEAVMTTSSPKTPITITKYVPPGHTKSASENKSLKVTISDKECKPTIKTLLPVRPPPPAAPAPEPTIAEPQKPKEVKIKEESDEEASSSQTPKSRPRKRTVSEPMLKKPKLSKAVTDSLEEEAAVAAEPTPSTSSGAGTPGPSSSGYRFSRNRTPVPRVSLEKLNVTHDSKGRVVVAPVEENNKTDNTESRRHVKKFKTANNISKKPKGISSSEEAASKTEPTEATPALTVETAATTSATAEESDLCDNLRKEEIINCTCGFTEEDGLMIQCDLCLCWQHGYCNNIKEEAEVPEKYVCYICLHPARQRESMRHCHNQDWLKEGKLSSFSFSKKDSVVSEQREQMLKKSHDLSASVLQLETVIHSLNVKTHIATMKQDHPKLYLWAKSWKDNSPDVKNENEQIKTDVVGPQPEAAIDTKECRLRLLEHIEDYQTKVEDRLTSIDAALSVLEAEDPELSSDVSDARMKQTMQLLLRDLSTLKEVAELNM
ncbi:PHD finger protein 20-like isoform X2 [Macrosteles quadrilineatus]|uniref:PHD finger protein 20-like isoform X2 n=1 Tax=Macrosteles quadrilineatus TaxID=74068 RepID=UPI0023E1BEF1|nr:PHD finger protein 20-like isoform X2 [Macrosteles quadrilineatus]